MAGPSIVERHLGEGHLSALLFEAHTNTWVVVEGQLDVARAVRGSRAGCCLADFVFNVAFAPALVDVGAPWAMPVSLLPPGTYLPFAMLPALCGVRIMPMPYAGDSCFCCVFRST